MGDLTLHVGSDPLNRLPIPHCLPESLKLSKYPEESAAGRSCRLSQMNEWDVSAARLAKTHGYAAKTDYHKDGEMARKSAELARDILKLARNTLFINLRFMEQALHKLILSDDETVTAETATDGLFLYINSLHLCRNFKKNPGITVRDLLHLTLHCVFRHMFVGKKIDREAWDLACDIAVEEVICELDLKCCYCERQEKQNWLYKKLKKDLPRLTAERIYKWLKTSGIPEEEYKRIREYFYGDDHRIWYKEVKKEAGSGNGDEKENNPSSENEGSPEGDMNADGNGFADPPEGTEGTDSDVNASGSFTGEESDHGDSGTGMAGKGGENQKDQKALSPSEVEQQWKDISERMKIDLETVSSSYGNGTGDFIEALKEVNREKYDYAAFLKRFSVIGENIEVNDDEFDYIFYTYGLKLYRNMPLVEPLEYKDVKKVREFVIALDTSESVAGELVQQFVTKTWNLMKQTDNFFSKVNIHILQCGAKVEEDQKITTQEEFDAYMKRMVLKGFGGTDFRPVFEHVDAMIRQHEFTNFKGLIYFTDGYGTYPVKAPGYEAAFVFLDQGRDIPEVPVWAIRMLLTEDDIREL